jgi:hypothetical protein
MNSAYATSMHSMNPCLRDDVVSIAQYFKTPNRVYIGSNGHIYTQRPCKGIFFLIIKIINFIERIFLQSWIKNFTANRKLNEVVSLSIQIIPQAIHESSQAFGRRHRTVEDFVLDRINSELVKSSIHSISEEINLKKYNKAIKIRTLRDLLDFYAKEILI